MGHSTKKERQQRILEQLQNSQGVTGNQLAAQYKVSRGTILNDISELRRQGYPIQISSQVAEGGIMAAVYELPKYRPKS